MLLQIRIVNDMHVNIKRLEDSNSPWKPDEVIDVNSGTDLFIIITLRAEFYILFE